MCAGIHISRGYTYHCDTGIFSGQGEHIRKIWLIKGNDNTDVYQSADCLPEMRKHCEYKIIHEKFHFLITAPIRKSRFASKIPIQILRHLPSFLRLCQRLALCVVISTCIERAYMSTSYSEDFESPRLSSIGFRSAGGFLALFVNEAKLYWQRTAS